MAALSLTHNMNPLGQNIRMCYSAGSTGAFEKLNEDLAWEGGRELEL